MTLVIDSLSRGPHGAIFYLAVLLGPAAFGVTIYFLVSRLRLWDRAGAASVGVSASFIASIVVFVAVAVFTFT